MLPEKFLRWQCAEVCEAANTDLTNIPHLFQHRIRLSEPAGESGLDQASTIVASANESCAFSEVNARLGDPSRAIERLPGNEKAPQPALCLISVSKQS
jgi:hypothetical protein